MYTLLLAGAIFGQCQMINGRMVCPLQRPAAQAAPVQPPVVIRYIQIPVRTRPRPAVATKPKPQPSLSFGSYEKWY